MTSLERQNNEMRLYETTGRRWDITENEKIPYFTIKCESENISFNAENSQELGLFIRALSTGFILSQIDKLNEQAAAMRIKQKKARLNKAFNPWKFVIGKGEMRPQLELVHMLGGFAYATDCHVLVKVHFDYAEELEDKLVNDDFKPVEMQNQYPNCDAVMLCKRDGVTEFELRHDAAWFSSTAKQMKKDWKERDTKTYCKVGEHFFSHDTCEKLSYWLKYYTPTECLQASTGCIQFRDADGNTFLAMAYRIDNVDDIEGMVYE